MSAVELEDARSAAAGAAGKGAYVRRMFSAIAPRYDRLNRLLSFNLDRSWRRRAIAELSIARRPDGCYLDLCAGTLDVAASIARVAGFSGTVIGADFSEAMIREAGPKRAERGVNGVVADALALPVATASCAGAIVAFGIRNVADLDAALREVARALEPGSRFVILEFSTPPNRVVRTAYHAYFHHVLPRIGALLSGHESAYAYLPLSVAHFPDVRALGARMERAGFRDVTWQTRMFGVVAIHTGTRASHAPRPGASPNA